MTKRERFVTALNDGRPDRLPGQVHNWMPYYFQHYLGGIDARMAYERFDLDCAIYIHPRYIDRPQDLANGQEKHTDLGVDAPGHRCGVVEIVTPKGTLRRRYATTDITTFDTEDSNHEVNDER